MLSIYENIKPPKLWSQWILNQVDNFGVDTISDFQHLMNNNSLKLTNIKGDDSDFNGSNSTLQKYIIIMLGRKISADRCKSPF